jgi:TrmH family RNA methyltransferase
LPTAAELDRLQVVLVSTRNALNIGAAARAMSNFGFKHLRVVNPYEPSYREARSAVGGTSVLANSQQFASVAEAVADCRLVVGTTAGRRPNPQIEMRRLEEGARLIRRRMASGRVALLFGSEKFGLSNADLSHCDWLLRAPTCEANISMNLGQAVAVCLYELIRDGKAAPRTEKNEPATAGEVERITAQLLEVLLESGFLVRRRVGDAELRIRRLVRRLNLPARDAVMWLGIWRQILWKLRANDESPSGKP